MLGSASLPATIWQSSRLKYSGFRRSWQVRLQDCHRGHSAKVVGCAVGAAGGLPTGPPRPPRPRSVESDRRTPQCCGSCGPPATGTPRPACGPLPPAGGDHLPPTAVRLSNSHRPPSGATAGISRRWSTNRAAMLRRLPARTRAVGQLRGRRCACSPGGDPQCRPGQGSDPHLLERDAPRAVKRRRQAGGGRTSLLECAF